MLTSQLPGITSLLPSHNLKQKPRSLKRAATAMRIASDLLPETMIAAGMVTEIDEEDLVGVVLALDGAGAPGREEAVAMTETTSQCSHRLAQQFQGSNLER